MLNLLFVIEAFFVTLRKAVHAGFQKCVLYHRNFSFHMDVHELKLNIILKHMYFVGAYFY